MTLDLTAIVVLGVAIVVLCAVIIALVHLRHRDRGTRKRHGGPTIEMTG